MEHWGRAGKGGRQRWKEGEMGEDGTLGKGGGG